MMVKQTVDDTISKYRIVTLEVSNNTQQLAFMNELVLTNQSGEAIPFSMFSDNYFTLKPNEHRIITLKYPIDNIASNIVIRTWNTPQHSIKL